MNRIADTPPVTPGAPRASGTLTRCTRFTAVAILWAALAALPVTAADPLAAQLQRGLVEEEANRNPEAALKAYEEVVRQIDSQRQLAATAIFRTGEIYRKLGRTNEAVAQYRRILSEFRGEETLGNLSRQNLAVLGVHETAPARGREAELIEQEIRLAEQEIAAQEKMVKVGLAPTEKVTAARRELLQLQRQLVVAQGGAIPGTSPASAKEQALIQEEIKLAERELAQIQEKFKMGVATEDSLLGPRREVLKLQRQLLVAQGRGSEEAPPVAGARAESPEAGEIQRLRSLMQNSPDLLNAPVPANGNETPLQSAASKGELEVVRFLLQSGAERDAKGARTSPPIHFAAARGHKAIVDLFLTQGTPPDIKGAGGATPLHLAAGAGHRKVVERLLEAGADPNVVMSSDIQSDTFGLRLAAGTTPLRAAIVMEKPGIAELLLEAKGNGDAGAAPGGTPLETAVDLGEVGLVRRMLEGGAAKLPEARTELLLRAIGRGRLPMVEQLLQSGADPNGAPAFPALVRVLESGNSPEILRALLSAGARVDPLSAAGTTPLQILLARMGSSQRSGPAPDPEPAQKACLELLLKAKADTSRHFPDGAPMIQATPQLPPQTVSRLLEAGTPPDERLM
ncbi:MAG TPA: hypothetical protein DCM86_00775, partial [Verrucomicrobiales bacterium]|nr:hypothetical protein [Verrucomicrobiales bacterium]